jgi:hypothetical protein
MPIVLFIVGTIVATLLIQFGWNIGLVEAGVANHGVDFWTALALLVCLGFVRAIFARQATFITHKEQV